MTESSVWCSCHSQSIFFLFYIFTVLLVPRCLLVCTFIHDGKDIQTFYFTFFFIFLFYKPCERCLRHIHIYSYIHTSCDVLWSAMSQRQSKRVVLWLNERLSIRPPYSLVFLRHCCCSVRDFWTSLQVDSQSTHSWGAGVTQEKKCLASSGGKMFV